MKRLYVGMVILACFSVLGNTPLKVEARQQQEDQVIKSAKLLAVLSQKRLIQICPNDINVLVLVEPLWWKTLTYVRKQNMVLAMLHVARSEKKRPEFVTFVEMISHKTIARGWVEDGRIEIFE